MRVEEEGARGTTGGRTCLLGSDPLALLRDEQLPRGWTLDVDPASLL